MLQVTLPTVPDLLALHARHPARYPYLLQTLGSGGGWDILFACPEYSRRFMLGESGFFAALEEEWERHGRRPPPARDGVPFSGGWFLYLGYEVLQQIEPSVPARRGKENFPVAVMSRVPAAILVDRQRQRSVVVAEVEHAGCLEQIQSDLATPPEWRPRRLAVEGLLAEAPERYLAGVDRVKRYIREGDVFQVNLARRWNGTLAGGAKSPDLYHALAQHNPAPFGGVVDFGDCQIVSSSPERLARVRDGLIDTRPIAGTRARAVDPSTDERLRSDLLATAKERAEHVMLVDLERNDLGRVCTPGSVEVPALLDVATYAHVHHLESTVRGRLRQGARPAEVIRALFPGGTITGCPKVRCMQIIRELEDAPRLAYTGSMGYLTRDGGLDLNILIRSFMLQGDRLTFWAGAGIVADSIPEQELDETQAKARGLLNAINVG
jgi:anthranilate synthase component 1